MSIETYEKAMYINDIYKKLETAERSVANGDVSDAFETVKRIRDLKNV